jgi:hypothetical protein
VLLGAEFTQVWTTRYGRGLEPERHARLVEHHPDSVEEEEDDTTESRDHNVRR